MRLLWPPTPSGVAAAPVWVYQTASMALPHPADTIAAIATAPGEGAIAIVRVSGPDSFSLADRLFRCPPPPPSARAAGTFVHGQVVEPATGEVLDDALLLVFRSPHSYTGEDSVEIQCHGGAQAARRILDALLVAGARQAEPGEFTKRAFLNDKIDLTQAEAVLDLIQARSERAARLATAQLEDAIGKRIRSVYDALLAAGADIEAMLDFSDDELPQGIPSEISARLSSVFHTIQGLLDTWQEGRILREGARIVIAGAPNVGKSTLLNLLAGRDRAIVSPHPGTTRDTIEESVQLQGYPVQLVDTAGLRDSPCEIEQEGIRRTHQALAHSDLFICILDASQPLSSGEKAFLRAHDPKKTLVLLNKIDLGIQIFPEHLPGFDCSPISLKIDPPLDALSNKIVQKLVQRPAGSDHGAVAIAERHKNALFIALDEVKVAKNLFEAAREEDFLPAATHIRTAVESVGHILGKNVTDEILDSIFSRFCVGK